MYAYLKHGHKIKISKEEADEITRVKKSRTRNIAREVRDKGGEGDLVLYIEIDEVICITR